MTALRVQFSQRPEEGVADRFGLQLSETDPESWQTRRKPDLSHLGKPRTANAWVWYCGYMKLCPGQVLVAGGMWEVEEEKGLKKETAALLATPQETRTLKSTGAHCWGCGLMRDGRQKAAGFHHLNLNEIAQVLGRNSLAGKRILPESAISVPAAADTFL